MAEKQSTSFRDLINGETPVVIDFFATWCGPCHAYSPILGQLKEDLGDAIRLVKVDVDKNQEISEKLAIKAMPTTMIFQNGVVKFRAAGVQTIAALKAEIAKLN
jgi:thioredoxin 1